MADRQIKIQSVGAFYFQVTQKGKKQCFNVASFQLEKVLGKLPYVNIGITDVTKNNSVQIINTTFPKLSSIKELYKSVSIGKGALLDCRLVQIRTNGSPRQKQWFRGKLATITPFVNTESGVSSGMNCYCMSKACQLMFSVHSDFIYAPATEARNIEALYNYQVFSNRFMQRKMFSQSQKLNIPVLVQLCEANANDDILTMAQKSLDALSKWQKNSSSDQVAKALPRYELSKYFINKWKLSQVYREYKDSAQHPYIQSFGQDFLNNYMTETILDSFISALSSNWRMLTVVPPARGQQDKLEIVPTFNSPKANFTLTTQDMLSCHVAASPVTHLKTPDKIYTRSPLSTAFGGADTIGYSAAHGTYELRSSRNNENLKLKIIDIPSWMLNTILDQARAKQKQQTGKDTNLRNLTAQEQIKKAQVPASGPVVQEIGLKMLNSMAKTIFIHFFLRDKQASITLAISQKTLDIDKYVGKAISMQIPIQAEQLGGSPDTFYGVVSGVRYQYHASESPRNTSSLTATCSITGVTWKQDRQSAQLYQNIQDNLLYTKG